MSTSQVGGGLVLLVSALVVVVAVPVLSPLAMRHGLVSRPGPINPEPRPVPLVGGIGVLLGAAVVAAGFGAPAWWVVLAVAALVGAVDDRRGVPAPLRVVAWALLGAAAATTTDGPLLVGAGWGVAAAVGINLLDGRDGLATGVGAVALIGLGLLAADASPARLVPALVGFLVWNLPPARAYLGNAGASLLGIALAAGAVTATPAAGTAPVALVLGLVIAEVATTTIRRVRARRGLDRRERGHGYDRLVARGWPVALVSLTYAGVQAALVLAAVTAVNTSGLVGVAVVVVALALLMALVLGSGALVPDPAVEG